MINELRFPPLVWHYLQLSVAFYATNSQSALNRPSSDQLQFDRSYSSYLVITHTINQTIMLSSKLIATIAIISIAVSVSSAADTVGNKQRTLLKTRKGRRNNIKVENVMNEEDVVFFTRTLQGGSLPPSGGGGTAPGTMEPVPATPLPTDMVRIFDIAFQLTYLVCC